MYRLLILSAASIVAFATSSAEEFDHVAAIKGLRDGDSKKGRELYATHCLACHGKDGKLALNPLARRFAIDELKFGNDPYSLWKTTSYGNGLMFRWDAVLSAQERYQIIHHIREDIIKPNNPGQYFEPGEDYFAKLPDIAKKDAEDQAANVQKVEVAAGMIDGTAGKSMIYGPFLQHGLNFSKPKDKDAAHIEDTTERALIVDLPGNSVVAYDAARLSVSGIWRGKIADTEDTHHTSYKGGHALMPDGELYYKNVDVIGWAVGEPESPKGYGHLHFKGHFLHGETVVLSYAVAGRDVLESPGSTGTSTISRSFQVAAGKDELFCLVGDAKKFPAAKVESAHSGIQVVDGPGGTRWIHVPATEEALAFTLWVSPVGNPEVPSDFDTPDFAALTKGGSRRWPHTVTTALAPGDPVEGYAVDILTVPLANPYGAWMRLSALDFFADGRVAVSTLSGDVWIVSWTKENPNALTWSRFATGLYEPLGLKVVHEKIYVRGRDRITRLHDLNGDGEADHYESFFEDTNEIGASYHAFKYELQTDEAGNFYYSQSGYKSPLTGAVVRVSPDGKSSEFIGTDLRNPNGMGAGGPDDWVTIADNPSAVSIYNGFTLAKKDATYGYEKSRTTPMLVVLPATVDSSSGGQCWSDSKCWGPLSGSIVHAAYSRCALFYCMTQNIPPYPNGFAVRLPFDLQSGPLRPRVSPTDGQVYVAAQKGWDTQAPLDGAIYRIRSTGGPSHLVENAAATATGIRLMFSCDLDPTSVVAENFSAVRESDKATKNEPLQKPFPLGEVVMVDKRTVEVTIPGIEYEALEHRTETDKKTGAVTAIKVNPAISLTYDIKAADGPPIQQTVHATINSLP